MSSRKRAAPKRFRVGRVSVYIHHGSALTPNCLKAAAAANLVADGKGPEGSLLMAEERARWRRQAFDWLEADIDLRTKQWESFSEPERAYSRQLLEQFMKVPELASVRGSAGLAKLP